MSDRPLRRRAARGLAVAVAGLFAGHVLVYRIVAPNVAQRAALLAGTGHAYLPVALALGLILATVAGATAFALGFRRATGLGAGPGRSGSVGLIGALVIPAVLQAVAFLALEVLERALAGAPMGGLLGPLLPDGVALQLVVGAAGGLALVGLDRAGQSGPAVARPGGARRRNRPHPTHRRRSSSPPHPATSGVPRCRPDPPTRLEGAPLRIPRSGCAPRAPLGPLRNPVAYSQGAVASDIPKKGTPPCEVFDSPWAPSPWGLPACSSRPPSRTPRRTPAPT